VENDVKQAKALGLNRWPSRHWAINVAWPQVVVVAARQPASSARGVQARGVQARGVQARAQAGGRVRRQSGIPNAADRP
jgi:hypothetical protein